jgi:hypothetical protein
MGADIPNIIPLDKVIPGFARPQESADDLVAEYEAWVAGDADGHDTAITAYRVRAAKRSEGAHQFALRFLQPEYVCSHGECECATQKSVLVQLEGRLATARGRRREYEALEGTLERQIERHKDRNGLA